MMMLRLPSTCVLYVCVDIAASCSSCAVILAAYWPSDDSTPVLYLPSTNTLGMCVPVVLIVDVKCSCAADARG